MLLQMNGWEATMHVKGFILEDDQGREYILGCEQPGAQIGKTFLLRGWQRRRLIPLPYSEQERRMIVGEILLTLNELFATLPRLSENREDGVSTGRVNSPNGSDYV